MKYALNIEKDGTGYMAVFPDIPEALTSGDTVEETLEMAEDALLTAIEMRMDQRRAVPMPVATIRAHAVHLPEMQQAKVLLWNTMVKEKISKTELAKRLGKTEGYVRKLLDPYHNATIKSLADAAIALKKRISMELVPA